MSLTSNSRANYSGVYALALRTRCTSRMKRITRILFAQLGQSGTPGFLYPCLVIINQLRYVLLKNQHIHVDAKYNHLIIIFDHLIFITVMSLVVSFRQLISYKVEVKVVADNKLTTPINRLLGC